MPTAPLPTTGVIRQGIKIGVSRRPLYLAVLLLLCNLPLQGRAAQILTTDVDLNCSQSDPMLACSYRLLSSSSSSSIIARAANQPLEIVTLKAYPSTDSITAVLFLVDTSDPDRQEVIERNAAQIADMLARADPHHRFGLANFDKELIVNVPIGGSADAIITAARTLKAVGMTTELYRNTLQAIDVIARTNADRKVIYLMSDGQAEDKAYFHEDVIRTARRYGIVINSLGYPRSVPLSVALQTLRRLSEETGGIYIETGINFALPESFLQSPFANIDRGGQFIVDLGPLLRSPPDPPAISVRFETGINVLDVAVPITVRPPVTPVPQAATDTPAVTQTAPVMIATASSPVDTVLWYGIPIALVLLSLLTLATLVLLYRRQGTSSVPVAPVISIPNRPLAYLIRQDEGGKSFPISTATCRIGRSRDNEMTIEDNSVSRRHAEIRRTFDGRFVLYDRDSTNGVFVNDEKISRHTLAEGDIIEIGDVFLRFSQKPADFHFADSTAIVKTRAP